MNILLDQEKFAKLAQYCLDACEVSLFFKAHNGEVQYIPPVMCEICQEIRKVPGLYRECQDCSAWAFQRCYETRQVQIYQCHMGFTEVVLPVMLDSLFIGYLSFGQIIHAEQPGCEQRILERLEAAFRLHGFAIEGFQVKVAQSVHMNTARLRALSELMRLCASHMVLSEIVKTETFTLPYLLDRYIEQHLSETITCRDLCKALNISRSQLYSLADKCYHCGVIERVHSRRIEKAQELLSATELEIGRIGEQVGLSDSAYFARFFRKRTGLTPTQYRQHSKARP